METYISVRIAACCTAALALVYFVIYQKTFGAVSHAQFEMGQALALGITLLTLTYIDLRTRLLFDFLTLPLMLAGLALSLVQYPGILPSAMGAAVGYSLIAGLNLYWRRRFGRDGIGLGDAKLLAAGGTWTGVVGLPQILLIASGFSLLAVLPIMFRARNKLVGVELPFGPALALGIWVTWCIPIVPKT